MQANSALPQSDDCTHISDPCFVVPSLASSDHIHHRQPTPGTNWWSPCRPAKASCPNAGNVHKFRSVSCRMPGHSGPLHGPGREWHFVTFGFGLLGRCWKEGGSAPSTVLWSSVTTATCCCVSLAETSRTKPGLLVTKHQTLAGRAS